MSSRGSPPDDKAEVRQHEFGADNISDVPAAHHDPHHRHAHHSKVSKEIERIDAIALAENTTLESFRHLDENKILRKVRLPCASSHSVSCVYVFYHAHPATTDGHTSHTRTGTALPIILPRS